MAVFAMEIAFVLALAVFAGGLALLHFASRAGSGLLRAAALVALIGSALSAAETTYYGIRYYAQGDFDAACPMMGHGMMHGGGPGGGWMGPHGMMPPGMGMAPGAPPGTMGPGMRGPHGPMGPGTMGGPGAPTAPPAAEKPPQQ